MKLIINPHKYRKIIQTNVYNISNDNEWLTWYIMGESIPKAMHYSRISSYEVEM